MAYPGIYFIENVEIGTAGDLFYWKSWNGVQFGIYFIEQVKIMYGWEFISLKRSK